MVEQPVSAVELARGALDLSQVLVQSSQPEVSGGSASSEEAFGPSQQGRCTNGLAGMRCSKPEKHGGLCRYTTLQQRRSAADAGS